MKKIPTILFLCLATWLGAGAVVPTIMRDTDTRACRRWVDSVYNSLSQRQRVAQLVCGKAVPTQGAASRKAIRRMVQTDGVGAMLFTSGSLDDYVEMTNYAQSLAQVPLFMTFDGEWGLAMRVAGTPKFPCNMTLGAVRDTRLLRDYGAEMGRQCREIGVNVNFAPDMDVNSNPRNPVIGYRSFGEDPARVAAAGVAYARGLESARVLSSAKHFPGHGDTDSDSHKTGVTVNHSREQLDRVDLVPFDKYIGAGLSGVMVGHIAVPALDPSGRPASLSHAISTGLLRDRLGFEGLIYTDALEMAGAKLPGKNSALEALRAGADVLLSSGNPSRDIDAICAALDNGSLDAKVVEDRCRRVLSYKYAIGLDHRPDEIKLAGLRGRLDSPGSRRVMDALAAGAITVLRNEGGILPIGKLATAKIAVVNIGEPARNDFSDLCARYTRVDRFSAPLGATTLDALRSYDVVIAAVYNDSASSRKAMGQLADMPGLVGVFMINPYKMNKFHAALGHARALVLAYENLPCMRQAAAMALFGGIATSGRLPVDLPRIAPIGTGIRLPKSRIGYSSPLAEGFSPALTDSIDSIVEAAMASGAFPGAQVLVARHGNVVHERSYGLLTRGGAAVTDSTLYDFASVSKAAGTLPGVMKAVDLGLLEIDAPASRYIPALRPGAKKDITLRSLLFHESGMPPSLNMFDVMMDTASYTGRLISGRRDASHTIAIQKGAWGNNSARLRRDILSGRRTAETPVEAARGQWVGKAAFDTIMGRIYDIPLRKNRNYTYSCLNFCLLMDTEQRATGIPHDRWVTDSIWAPLGARTLCYRPSEHFDLARIAPTEKDNFLRRQTVHGHVHDETAAYLGGVSGNAGVFGSAEDLAKLCQMWLQGGRYGDVRVLGEETVRLFTTAKSPTCRRGLGFDKPDIARPDYSPTCEEASAEVYGHLGFTGTVFWVDPREDLIFIFLTNRVNPTRDNEAFNRANIRPELFRQVYRALR